MAEPPQPMRIDDAVVVTPAPSREPPITTNVWWNRILRGERLTEVEWQHELGTVEKNQAQDLILPSSGKSISDHGDQLFRCRGMVQDMLDIEYFPLETDDSAQGALPLSECTPLVVVPLVISSGHTSKSSNTQHRKKRTKKVIGSMEGNSTDITNNEQLQNNALEKETTTSTLCKGIVPSMDEYVVATFYFEQYPATSKSAPSKLRLNQLVEFLAVIEGGNHHDNNDIATQPSSDSSTYGMLFNDNMLQDDFDEVAIPTTVLRLHVVWFQPLTMVQLSTPSDQRITETSDAAHVYQCLANFCSIDLLTAQALWMLLHSQAERDNNGHALVAKDPLMTIGCASLAVHVGSNLVLIDRIIHLIQQLVPVVCILEYDAYDNTNQDILSPIKLQGRLRQTPLQLPAGTVVIIRMLSATTTTTTDSATANDGTMEILQKLCRCHHLDYTFDGGMLIPFEADYRVLVLSGHQDPINLLGCTMSVQCHETNPAVNTDLKNESLSCLRAWWLGHHQDRTNVPLPRSVLDRAQQDFIQRRPHVTPNDFHRWLTLCRLQARSQHHDTVEINDWEMALRLDDALLNASTASLSTSQRASEFQQFL